MRITQPVHLLLLALKEIALNTTTRPPKLVS